MLSPRTDASPPCGQTMWYSICCTSTMTRFGAGAGACFTPRRFASADLFPFRKRPYSSMREGGTAHNSYGKIGASWSCVAVVRRSKDNGSQILPCHQPSFPVWAAPSSLLGMRFLNEIPMEVSLPPSLQSLIHYQHSPVTCSGPLDR